MTENVIGKSDKCMFVSVLSEGVVVLLGTQSPWLDANQKNSVRDKSDIGIPLIIQEMIFVSKVTTKYVT